MPDAPRSFRSWPFGALFLCVLAAVLYVAMLASALGPDGMSGEARMGDAFQGLFVTAGLWLVLALLLLVGGIMGRMPRWAAVLAMFLHPFSAVAAVIALDMCSRHQGGAVIFLILLPLLIALYAMWARLPRWHAVFPPGPTSAVAWGAIFVLSALPSVLAIYY